MTELLAGSPIRLIEAGLPGEDMASIARRTGSFGAAPGDSDAQVLNKFAQYAIEENPGFKGDRGNPGADLGQIGTFADLQSMDILDAQPGATLLRLTDRPGPWRLWESGMPALDPSFENVAWTYDGSGTAQWFYSPDQDVLITGFGAVDDWNGTTGTNNFSAFEAAYALAPVTIRLPKSADGTGIYMVNGVTAVADATGIQLDPDPDVWVHVEGGSSIPATFIKGQTTTRDLRTEYAALRYQQPLIPSQRKRVTELGRPGSAFGGELQKPTRLSFADATHWQGTGTWPNIAFATATPSSVTADQVNWSVPPSASFVATMFHALPGDYLQAQLTDATTYFPAIAIFTDAEWILLRQEKTTGLDSLTMSQRVGSTNTVETSTSNPAIAQNTYRLIKSTVGIKIFDQRSFGLVVNGTIIRRYRTAGNIQRAGWAGGFGSGTALTISSPILFKNKRTFGIKPLSVISIGDSTGDETVTSQSQFDFMRQMIGGIGGCQIETLNNLAHSGDTSSAQLTKLQAVSLANAGYDYCCIQIGINDIQTGVAVSTFVNNVIAMVTYCRASGVEPIVGLPAMFYSQTDAQAYNQDGGATSNSAAGAAYRIALMQALADNDVYCNLASFEGMGAVIASLLTMKASPWGDQVVYDNIHPTVWGAMLLGNGWAKAIVAHLTSAFDPNLTSIGFPQSYAVGSVGATVMPTYRISGDTIHVAFYLSRNGASLPDNTIVMSLPRRLWPVDDTYGEIVNVGPLPGLVPVTATPGLLKIGADGNVRVYGVSTSPAPDFLAISASWKI